jgi:hypothetical protein
MTNNEYEKISIPLQTMLSFLDREKKYHYIILINNYNGYVPTVLFNGDLVLFNIF